MRITQRPTVVTVFGILNIVFGSIGVLGGFCGLLGVGAVIFLADQGRPDRNPFRQIMSKVLEEFQAVPGFIPEMLIQGVLGLILAFVLLFAGIGLLNLRPWARKASIIYAIIVMMNSVFHMFFMILYVNPAAVHLQAGAFAPPGQQPFQQVGSTFGAIVGGLAGMIYPVFILVFLLRSEIAEAFVPDQGAVLIRDLKEEEEEENDEGDWRPRRRMEPPSTGPDERIQ